MFCLTDFEFFEFPSFDIRESGCSLMYVTHSHEDALLV